MAGENIFQQWLQKPKSVLDYQASFDEADARKQVLKKNALELAAGQQTYDNSVRTNQDNALVRAALGGLGANATDDDRIQAMRRTGTPAGFTAADALDKSLIERRKGVAAANKDDAETAAKKLAQMSALHNFQSQKLAGVQTPEDALAWAQESHNLGMFSQPGQYERGLAVIQAAAQDPQAFAQWKQRAMQGGQTVAEQLKQQLDELKQREQVRQFGATEQRIRSENAADRGVTVRGQNMVDARANRTAEQGRIPVGYRAAPDGSLTFIPGGPADPSFKKATEFEGKSAIFGARAEEADRILSELNYSPSAVNAKTSAETTPLIGGTLGAAINRSVLNENDQKAEQAQRDFVNAVLRQESGAAIAESEFQNAKKQYFPQPGDSKGVIEQKARARKTTVQGLKLNAGASVFNASNAPAAPVPALPQGWSVTEKK